MNSRERTFLALDHKPADRIPVDFWASPGVVEALQKSLGASYEQILDRYEVDLRYIDGPAYMGPALAEGTDIWGVARGSVRTRCGDGSEVYQEVLVPPLAAAQSVADIEAYAHWPDPDWFDYSVVADQCRRIRERDRVVVFMGDRLNRVAQLKPAMYLRGSEDIFVDLAVRPDMAHAILRKIREFYTAYLARILQAADGGIDIVLTGDDFGAQNGMLVSRDMWRTFIGPGFAGYVDLIKAHSARAMHHTCGSVAELIPDLIDCGLDILQSVQPEADAMPLADLVAQFGDRLCFHGGISIQKLMPFGTPADIRAEVKRIAGLVRGRGGYIFCTAHNIQADTPVGNVLALLEAYREQDGPISAAPPTGS